MKRNSTLIFTIVVLALSLAACQLDFLNPNPPVATLDKDQINTIAARTVAARQTFSSLETLVSRLTQPVATSTGPVQPQVGTTTPGQPTRTPINTFTPLPSLTPVPPTATASNTPDIPCDAAAFVTDVTIPDFTLFSPDQAFVKTWRLRNIGRCAWTSGYSIVYSSGEQMGAVTSVNLTGEVKPGQTVDVSANLIAPKTAGKYTSNWKLKNSSGVVFGTGLSGTSVFWVKIEVGTVTLSNLDLTQVYCSAVWKSNSGTLPCPGSALDFTKGSITYSATPKLEIGYTDDEPALIMVPANGSGGEISGRFPSLKIKSGDKFVALTGCMDGYTKCSVMFMLNYSVDGGADVNLKTWSQTYDGNKELLGIDLTALADKNVQFVLKVLNNDSSSTDDVAFWLSPHIVRP